MATELTNEQMFKLVCIEVIESMGITFYTPMGILYEMTQPKFIAWCERMIFTDDDGELDQGELFLLDWMKQNIDNWEIIKELKPIAERLEKKLK